MPDSLSVKLSPGRKTKHGGYSFLTHGQLPEHRAYIERYLTGCRQGLINDLGGEANLSTAQAILIDRIISKLGCIRCIEEHTREGSVMVGQELAPALQRSYLAFSNSIRLDLQALGINSKATGEPLDLGRYVQEKYGVKDGEKK